MNPRDLDPAVVNVRTAAPSAPAPAPKVHNHAQPPAPPKPAITFPATATFVAKKNPPEDAPEGTQPTFVVDWKKMAVIACADDKFVAIPRTSAAKLPVVGPAVAASDGAEAPIEILPKIKASALICANHWNEHVGGPEGQTTAKFPEKVPHTEFVTLLQTEWEKDFFNRLLCKDATNIETLVATTQFAEAAKMAGLLEFCIVAISCAVRGKSNHEMALTLGRDVEELTSEELAAGRAAYPWAGNLTNPTE